MFDKAERCTYLARKHKKPHGSSIALPMSSFILHTLDQTFWALSTAACPILFVLLPTASTTNFVWRSHLSAQRTWSNLDNTLLRPGHADNETHLTKLDDDYTPLSVNF